MRPRFEKNLQGLSELAKMEKKVVAVPEEAKEFEASLNLYLKQAAGKQGTSKESQLKIYEIQKKKEKIMEKLKNKLACIDNPDCVWEKEVGAREIAFNVDKNKFTYKLAGNKKEATFGDLVTDIDWGNRYALDKNIPRNFLKKYLVECAKSDLRELLNEQTIINEVEGNVALEGRKEAYLGYKESLNSGQQEEKAGFISETIVKSILKKVSLDCDANFEVFEGDIFEDVEHKVDFAIKHINKSRGVEVEVGDKKDVGIQFTINTDLRILEKKTLQVRGAKRNIRPEWRIDDLILVVFPLNVAKSLVGKWKREGEPAGGPDQYLDQKLAEELFRTLMKDLIASEKIEEYWGKIKERFLGSN